ncbi:MAG: DNA starvation/stationary phase protection protein [Saprospiraceae bacterium]|nr:DNA starvation/stationary phase protection protein [Saprospiraceae bacterium]
MNKQNFETTVDQLNTLLSNYHVYYQNLRNFHWNVNGENFFDLHNKFEDLYNDAKLKIDEIAERILTLRYRPTSEMSEYLRRSSIEEAGKIDSDHKMVDITLNNHRILIENMRQVIEVADKAQDEGTIDLIAGFLSELEKKSWMLDAWRSKKMKSVEA